MDGGRCAAPRAPRRFEAGKEKNASMAGNKRAPRPSSADGLLGLAFSRVSGAPRSEGNALRLLRDGAENYPLWLQAIGEATRTVHLENYILEEDAIGHSFAVALTEAAARGVRVRVLYDWFGCVTRTSTRFWRFLRQHGVEVRCYNPPRPANPLGWISRDHRKVLCVDGHAAFTGGLCIGHDWVGDPLRRIPPWRDTAVAIKGPAVAQLDAAFADSWAAAGSPLPAEDLVPAEAVPAGGELPLWVIAGRPESMGLYRLEQIVAEVVEKTLWLADAYFVATTGYVHALCDAAADGVDVRLLVPGSSNFPVVQALSRAGYRPLLQAGVRVFEWNGPMMHAKTMVADGRWGRVGSSNSNISSWVANRELDIAVEAEGFAREMEAMYREDLANATEIVLHAGRVRLSGERPASGGRGRTSRAGRLVAGTVGFGSTVGAALSQHRALGPAEAKVMAVAGSLLLLLALFAAILPEFIAYPLAAIALWVGGALLVRAWKLRAPTPDAAEKR